MLVPPIFWLEIVNVLARRYRYPPAAIVEAVFELEQVGLATADVGRPGVLATIDAVARLGLTAYDAAYLVLAESADAQLLTADAHLAAGAADRALLAATGRRRGRGVRALCLRRLVGNLEGGRGLPVGAPIRPAVKQGPRPARETLY